MLEKTEIDEELMRDAKSMAFQISKWAFEGYGRKEVFNEEENESTAKCEAN